MTHLPLHYRDESTDSFPSDEERAAEVANLFVPDLASVEPVGVPHGPMLSLSVTEDLTSQFLNNSNGMRPEHSNRGNKRRTRTLSDTTTLSPLNNTDIDKPKKHFLSTKGAESDDSCQVKCVKMNGFSDAINDTVKPSMPLTSKSIPPDSPMNTSLPANASCFATPNNTNSVVQECSYRSVAVSPTSMSRSSKAILLVDSTNPHQSSRHEMRMEHYDPCCGLSPTSKSPSRVSSASSTTSRRPRLRSHSATYKLQTTSLMTNFSNLKDSDASIENNNNFIEEIGWTSSSTNLQPRPSPIPTSATISHNPRSPTNPPSQHCHSLLHSPSLRPPRLTSHNRKRSASDGVKGLLAANITCSPTNNSCRRDQFRSQAHGTHNLVGSTLCLNAGTMESTQSISSMEDTATTGKILNPSFSKKPKPNVVSNSQATWKNWTPKVTSTPTTATAAVATNRPNQYSSPTRSLSLGPTNAISPPPMLPSLSQRTLSPTNAPSFSSAQPTLAILPPVPATSIASTVSNNADTTAMNSTPDSGTMSSSWTRHLAIFRLFRVLLCLSLYVVLFTTTTITQLVPKDDRTPAGLHPSLPSTTSEATMTTRNTNVVEQEGQEPQEISGPGRQVKTFQGSWGLTLKDDIELDSVSSPSVKAKTNVEKSDESGKSNKSSSSSSSSSSSTVSTDNDTSKKQLRGKTTSGAVSTTTSTGRKKRQPIMAHAKRKQSLSHAGDTMKKESYPSSASRHHYYPMQHKPRPKKFVLEDVVIPSLQQKETLNSPNMKAFYKAGLHDAHHRHMTPQGMLQQLLILMGWISFVGILAEAGLREIRRRWRSVSPFSGSRNSSNWLPLSVISMSPPSRHDRSR